MSNLYIVATPIGNLEDITLRALRVLKEVDLILCEDTRQTRKLLDHYEIKTPTLSYHQHSKLGKVDQIAEELRAGKNIALASDAGTPGISDPGNYLVSKLMSSEVYKLEGLKIIPIPGPSALTAAASISGLPTDEFVFLGFLPHKKGRETLFREIASSERTVIFYESVHRIEKTLEKLKIMPEIKNRQIVVCREVTKMFETIYRGTAEEVLNQLKPGEIKGEFVVIVHGLH
jgi:16S rRNA (cytidine1402-2'-O)-methyltransferase